jgi:hypothetical protein
LKKLKEENLDCQFKKDKIRNSFAMKDTIFSYLETMELPEKGKAALCCCFWQQTTNSDNIF